MSASAPAPGWYPDPEGGGSRWWDGRSWTQFRGGTAVAVLVQPSLPGGTSTATPWIVLQALIPLLQVLAQLPYLLVFRTLFATQLALMQQSGDSALSPAATRELLSQYTGAFATSAVTFGLAALLSAAWVVLAVLDARRLDRLGIVQPFHWAWSFLGPVYPIGRAVVLHRRTGRGLAPLWLLLGAIAGSAVLAVGLELIVLLPSLQGFASSISASEPRCGC